jgi:DNA-binding NtrC family response regulator
MTSPPATWIRDVEQRFLTLWRRHGPDFIRSAEWVKIAESFGEGCEISPHSELPVVLASAQSLAVWWQIKFYLSWARPRANIFLIGPPGVGKEVFAQLIQRFVREEPADGKTPSMPNLDPKVARRQTPGRIDDPDAALRINCSALGPQVAMADLFGVGPTVAGAPPRGTQGLFGLGNGFAVFLDEFFDGPSEMYPMMLRVLENRQFNRVAETANTTLQLRTIIVAASNRYATHADVLRAADEGALRADLISRFVYVEVPPLMERRPDIPSLANQFLRTLNARDNAKCRYAKLTDASGKMLQRLKVNGTLFEWPGNVRQLRRLVETQAMLHEQTRGDVPHHAPRTDDSRRSLRDEVSMSPVAMGGSTRDLPATAGETTAPPVPEGELELHESEVVQWLRDPGPANAQAEAMPRPALMTWDAGWLTKARRRQLLAHLFGLMQERDRRSATARWVGVTCRELGLFSSQNVPARIKEQIGLTLGQIAQELNTFRLGSDRNREKA